MVMETVRVMAMEKPAAVAQRFGRQNPKKTQHSDTAEHKKHKRFYKPIL